MSEFFKNIAEYLIVGVCCFLYATLFLKHNEKRGDFVLRIAVCGIIYTAVCVLLASLTFLGLENTYKFFTHTVVQLIIIFAIGVLYKINIVNQLFVGYWSAVLNQCARLVLNIIITVIEASFTVEVNFVAEDIARVLLTVCIYFVLKYAVVKDLRFEVEKNGIGFVILFIVISSIIMLLSVFTSIIEESSYLAYIFFLFCEVACCLLILTIYFTFISRQNVAIEKGIIEKLYEDETKQFDRMNETIEIINIKCHDIRHNILQGINNSDAEEAVNEFDSNIRTGNRVLDIVLTEKSLRCMVNKIMFTCVADGKQLAFMEKGDICTLFGNAIENAIESLEGVPEQNRFISVQVKRVSDFISVHIENYFDGELSLVDGLPETSKADKGSHGFGMKSIRNTVEKYDGGVSVKVEDEMFQLDCLFPAVNDGTC